MDLSIISLEALLNFTSQRLPGDVETEQPSIFPTTSARCVLNSIIESHQNLQILQNLSDSVCFRTDVKKKPGIPDDLDGMAMESKLRALSSSVLASLASDLLLAPENFEACRHFCSVTNIMISVCEGIKVY